MTADRLEIMTEAFKSLGEQRFQIDRLVAAELPGESFFTIKWKMITDVIGLGPRSATVREAGNLLELLTEELPSAMNYAEKHAERDGGNAAPIIAQLEEMAETARQALGDDVYQDMAMDRRSPPTPRPRR